MGFNMDDLSIHALQTAQANAAASSTGTARSQTDTGLDFQSLLSTLLLSSGQGSSSDQGLFGGDLITPVLITLIEKLASQSLGQTSGSETSGVSLASQSAIWNALPVAYGVSKAAPQGAPVQGYLTQGYHAGHNGLDFGVVVGTPVQATQSGKVVYAGWNEQGYGNLVIVENGPYRTYYAHLSQIPVSVGESIAAGQVVGLSGNTGHSTGPHLHYEVRVDGQAVDPTSFTLGTTGVNSVSG